MRSKWIWITGLILVFLIGCAAPEAEPALTIPTATAEEASALVQVTEVAGADVASDEAPSDDKAATTTPPNTPTSEPTIATETDGGDVERNEEAASVEQNETDNDAALTGGGETVDPEPVKDEPTAEPTDAPLILPTAEATATIVPVQATQVSKETSEEASQPAAEEGVKVPASLETMVNEMIVDAESRFGVQRAAITVSLLEEVTWRDGSLGCPEPGGMYTMALVGGYMIVLDIEGKPANYHSNGTQFWKYCENFDPKNPGTVDGGATGGDQ